mmetsp:Transcript_54148/g.154241  ORF Transcript_54148/g.154241 Transcript_54148/m.154241 type:complete len:485 (+) Transcript_54148:91-1545(+)
MMVCRLVATALLTCSAATSLNPAGVLHDSLGLLQFSTWISNGLSSTEGVLLQASRALFGAGHAVRQAPLETPPILKVVKVSHRLSSNTAGTDLQIHVGRDDCPDCPFGLGDDVNISLDARLPQGFHDGDRFAMDVHIKLLSLGQTHVYSWLIGAVFGERITASGNCTLCSGVCQLSLVPKGGHTTVTIPTILQSSAYCSGAGSVPEGLQALAVKLPLQLPQLGRVVEALIPDIDMEVNFAVRGAGGETVASTTSVVSFAPAAGQPAANVMSTPQSWLTVGRMIEAEATKSGYTAAGLTVKATVHQLEGGWQPNMSLAMPGCSAATFPSGEGRWQCALRFGEAPDLTAWLVLAADLEPGSVLRVSAGNYKVPGMLGRMIRDTIAPFLNKRIEIPLCGRKSTSLRLMGRTVVFPLAPCGHYHLDADMARTVEVPAAEVLKKLEFPGFPLSVGIILSLPAVSASVHMTALHKDGRVIADATFELGIM